MNALIVGTYSGDAADSELCFSCHNGLGSAFDTLTQFGQPFSHSLAPEISAYGSEKKGCYSCHDSHGTAREPGGAPYPSLLEVYDENGNAQRKGDAFCEACHQVRPGNLFPGAGVWRKTAHSSELAVTEGSEITCTICHLSHGSQNSALIVSELKPSGEDTVSVPSNGRWLCLGCHMTAQSTYAGGSTYQSSAHGSSAASKTVDAEYAERIPAGSSYSSRRVGECQSCHVAMGADDGAGDPIDRLARVDGMALCTECHGVGSAIAADLGSVYATAGAPVLEVVSAFSGAAGMPQYGAVQVRTRESSTSANLLSPRQVLDTDVGPMVSGDLDNDGKSEVLISRSNTSDLSIIRRSALAGITSQPGTITIGSEPSYMAVDDVLLDSSDYNEVMTADGDTLRFYRWNGATLGLVASVDVTNTITGLATGDVIGTDAADVVLTTTGEAASDNRIVIVSGTVMPAIVSSFEVEGTLPRGPSVGDLGPSAKDEIAVVMGGDVADVLQIYQGTGGAPLAKTGAVTGSQRAQRALVNDVLWGIQALGRSANEVAVTFADPAEGGRVEIFPQAAGGGFGASFGMALAPYSNPAEMAAGDVDGDAQDELVVARSGSMDNGVPAGTEVIQANETGTALAGSVFYPASGAESGDDVPGRAWVSILDLGPLGLSRHATDRTPDVHVSTEWNDFPRHVDCVDCHNTHEATSTVAVAPAAMGEIEGSWGVSVVNAPADEYTYSEKQGVDYEYELCLKCHGSLAVDKETRNIGEEVDTRNASVHAVEEASTSSEVIPGSFEPTDTPWTNSSVLYCTDCHGNADAGEPKGPHASTEAPLLKSPFVGTTPADEDLLCYDCHRYDVYVTGIADSNPTTGSRFYHDGATPLRLHMSHVSTAGITCAACHNSHGASLEHLMRDDVGFEHGASGGSCSDACHDGDTRTYGGR